jgi:hypothetical protein
MGLTGTSSSPVGSAAKAISANRGVRKNAVNIQPKLERLFSEATWGTRPTLAKK